MAGDVVSAIVAFAILQVIEPVMHGLALPEWLLKAVVIGLGLGLPVTLLLAWAYDISPQGIERTPSPAGASVQPSARAYRALALAALGLLLASPAVLYYLVRVEPRTPIASSGESANAASVAVLPFVNMSDDPGNDYFSDGLSEEILNALAGIPGLRVPARTSSFAFKGQAQDVAKIGASLRVANLLEGSVRKAGGRVRISAQLVSTSTSGRERTSAASRMSLPLRTRSRRTSPPHSRCNSFPRTAPPRRRPAPPPTPKRTRLTCWAGTR